MVDKQGTLHSPNEAISGQFECYYHSHYNISSASANLHDKRAHLIHDFLKNFSPPSILVEMAHKRKAPLSEAEFAKALKDMKAR